MIIHVGRARPEDYAAAVALLESCALPTDDVTLEGFEHFLIARLEGTAELAGVIGIEEYGDYGLLRSLAVAPDRRGNGVAQALVEGLEALATSRGVRSLYLLTTSAATYFEGRGYETLGREAAPDAIRTTREFSELCPDSAIFMSRALT